MVGGEQAAFDIVAPLLEIMGQKPSIVAQAAPDRLPRSATT